MNDPTPTPEMTEQEIAELAELVDRLAANPIDDPAEAPKMTETTSLVPPPAVDRSAEEVTPNFKGAGASPPKSEAKPPTSKRASAKAPAAKKVAKAPASKAAKSTAKKAPAKAPAAKKATTARVPRAPRGRSGMFRDAAIKLLRGRKPMTVKELTEVAIDKGLIESHGKTPAQTMATLLYTDKTATFVKVPPGDGRKNGVRWTLAPDPVQS